MRTPFEIHDYYSKLFETFGNLLLEDIAVALRMEDGKYVVKSDYFGICKHYARLRAYLNRMPPSPERQQLIQEHIDYKEPIYQHLLECPEDRVPAAANRIALRVRYFQLLHPESDDKATEWVSSRAVRWGYNMDHLNTPVEEVERTSCLTAEERKLLPLEKVKAELLRAEALLEHDNERRRLGLEKGQAKYDQSRQVKRALKNGHKALLPVLSAVIDYSRGEEHVCYNFADTSSIPTNCVTQPDDFEPWLNNAKKPELKTYRRKLTSISAIDVTRLGALQKSFESGVYSLNDLQHEFAGVEIVLPTLGQWISPAHNSVAPTFWEGLKDELLRIQIQSEIRYNLVSEKLGKPLFAQAHKGVVFTSADAPLQQPGNGGRQTVKEPKKAKLLPGFTVDEVRGILQETGMGNRYTQPGEWATAFRALHIVGILTGGPAAMERWAIEEGYSGMFSQSTLKTPWRDEWARPENADSTAKRTIFRSIVQSGEKMMKIKQLRNTNK